VIAFSLQSSENFWTPQLRHRMVSIYRAAKSAFPEILFIPGSNNIVIGSRDHLTRDPSILAERLKTRNIHANLVSADYLRYVYTNDRFQEIARTLESENAPINTDARPICYQYTLMIWLSKFLPSAKFRDFSFQTLGGRGAIVWVLVLIVPMLLLRKGPWFIRRAFLAGIAGCAGMVLETTLILHFQIKNGILFQDIGILLTSFMSGLALGAWAIAQIRQRLSKGLGISLLFGFALLSAAIGMAINSGRNTGLMETLGMLAAAGFLVAGIFSFAGLHEASDQRKAIAPLYSADLIGGCLGSILTSLALAPIMGFALTAQLMIPMALSSILLL